MGIIEISKSNRGIRLFGIFEITELGSIQIDSVVGIVRHFLRLQIRQKQDAEINRAPMRGEVYGRSSFHHKAGQLISRVTQLSSHGGDRKSEAYHNQTG